jgi:hypothetical protein
MSLPNSAALHENHSPCGGHGLCHCGGLGSSIGTHHFPHLGQCSISTAYCSMLVHVALGATTQQGRGGGAVSPMAYSTPALFLTFNSFFAMSHDIMGHSVLSLSHLQPTTAAKRKNATAANKNAAKKRRGKLDTADDTKYNDKEDVVPLTDAAL